MLCFAAVAALARIWGLAACGGKGGGGGEGIFNGRSSLKNAIYPHSSQANFTTTKIVLSCVSRPCLRVLFCHPASIGSQTNSAHAHTNMHNMHAYTYTPYTTPGQETSPAAAACIFFFFVEGVPEVFSRFVAAFGVAAGLDPFLLFIVDFMAGNHDCTSKCPDYTSPTCRCHEGDAWKLYVRLDAEEGAGISGALLTVLVSSGLVWAGGVLRNFSLLLGVAVGGVEFSRLFASGPTRLCNVVV